MRIKFCIFLTLCSFLCICSAAPARAAIDTAKTFKEANDCYQKGDWENAVQLYESLIHERPHLAEIYYNLGNAYYKLNEVGEARLNYERAHYLNPRDSEIRSNLAFVKSLIEYQLEDKRNWYLRKLSDLLSWLTFSELILITLLFYLLMLAVLFISLLSRRSLVNRLSIFLFAIFIICLLCVLFRYTYTPQKRAAIVTRGTVEVRYGPSQNDKTAFRLVEGMKVYIEKRRADWSRIKLVNGDTGWVPSAAIESIVPPSHAGFSLDTKGL